MPPSLQDAESMVAIAADAVAGDVVSLSDALDALPAPIYITDPDGVITYFNRACIEMAGRVPVASHDKWCVTWKLYTLDGEFLPHERCPMAIAIQEARVVRGEEALAERPDGTRVQFIPFPTPIFGRDGRMIGAVNLLMDVTELRRAESLRRESLRCRRLAAHMGDPRTTEIFRAMADEYDQQAAQIECRH